MKIENLPWLERYSAATYPELENVLKKKALIDDNVVKAIKTCYLNERQLTALGKQLAKDSSSLNLFAKTFNLGIVSNYNIDLLQYPIMASGLRYDRLFNITMGSFNNIAQEALNPHSELNSTSLDAILILLDHHFLQLEQDPQKAPEKVADEAIAFVHRIIEGFNQTRQVVCVISSIVAPPLLVEAQKVAVDEFNTKLRQNLKDSSHHVCDLAVLAQIVGLENWYQPAQYHWAKLSFSQSLVTLVSDKLARFIANLNAPAKKCIVLDLDNTLWGGVIGDAGTTGVAIGQGNALGEAFVEFQKVLLSLKAKGFLLAVCSKNDEKNAKDPFINRKDMLLSLDDFVVFKANWLPKSQNIRSIAEILSLGLDSFIFVDDNIIEREEVRLALPDVAVPALPEDPSFYPFVLLNSGFFDVCNSTTEDKNRTKLYQENAKREEYKQSFSDLKAFYASLEMKLTLYSILDENRARVVQLINKTNQFNLTQQRMTEADFFQWQQQEDHLALCFSLADKFGDNGIVGIILTSVNHDCLIIENFILSCRVIGREVEHAIINFLVSVAQEKQLNSLVGKFKPGVRNQIVANSYQKWGFDLISTTDREETTWQLKLDGFIELPHSIEILHKLSFTTEMV